MAQNMQWPSEDEDFDAVTTQEHLQFAQQPNGDNSSPEVIEREAPLVNSADEFFDFEPEQLAAVMAGTMEPSKLTQSTYQDDATAALTTTKEPVVQSFAPAAVTPQVPARPPKSVVVVSNDADQLAPSKPDDGWFAEELPFDPIEAAFSDDATLDAELAALVQKRPEPTPKKLSRKDRKAAKRAAKQEAKQAKKKPDAEPVEDHIEPTEVVPVKVLTQPTPQSTPESIPEPTHQETPLPVVASVPETEIAKAEPKAVKQPKEKKQKKEKQPKRGRKIARAFFELLLIAGIGAVGYYAYTAHQDNQDLQARIVTLSSANNNPQAAVQKQTDQLISTVGTLTTLPQDETPTVADVTNADIARQQSSFFANAQDGDKVLMYVKAGKAILYRPTANKIVLEAPLTLNTSAATTPAAATAPAPAATKVP